MTGQCGPPEKQSRQTRLSSVPLFNRVASSGLAVAVACLGSRRAFDGLWVGRSWIQAACSWSRVAVHLGSAHIRTFAGLFRTRTFGPHPCLLTLQRYGSGEPPESLGSVRRSMEAPKSLPALTSPCSAFSMFDKGQRWTGGKHSG